MSVEFHKHTPIFSVHLCMLSSIKDEIVKEYDSKINSSMIDQRGIDILLLVNAFPTLSCNVAVACIIVVSLLKFLLDSAV